MGIILREPAEALLSASLCLSRTFIAGITHLQAIALCGGVLQRPVRYRAGKTGAPLPASFIPINGMKLMGRYDKTSSCAIKDL
jgi:hypothetical protein